MEQKRKHRVSPVMGFERLRENVDGPGIRTLVLLGGCPLHCEYCLNKLLLRSGIQKEFTPDELYDILMVDSSYFKVTGGGITFGGGEPALHSRFIRDFYELCKEIDDELDIRLETSLNVPLEHIQLLAPFVSKFYVDVKDMNPEIYCDYTHEYNYFVYTNLEWLSKNGYAPKVLCRVPLIPEFNTEGNQVESVRALHEMGFETETFTYIKTHEPYQEIVTMGIPGDPDDLMGDLKPENNDMQGDDERKG